MILSLSAYVTKILKLLRCQYLYITLRNVKMYKGFFTACLANLCIYSNLPASTVLLSIGEHTEVDIKNVEFYNIGNKEVLNSKPIDSTNTLILKGKAKGSSELLLKLRDGKTRNIDFVVVSKAKKIKLNSLKNSIKRFGLLVRQLGDLIFVSGEIKKLTDLEELIGLSENFKELHLGKIIISKKNKNKHLAEIYQYFWKDGIKEVSCTNKQLNYICYYHSNKMSPNIREYLKKTKIPSNHKT